MLHRHPTDRAEFRLLAVALALLLWWTPLLGQVEEAVDHPAVTAHACHPADDAATEVAVGDCCEQFRCANCAACAPAGIGQAAQAPPPHPLAAPARHAAPGFRASTSVPETPYRPPSAHSV